jgi:hypothetical protein
MSFSRRSSSYILTFLTVLCSKLCILKNKDVAKIAVLTEKGRKDIRGIKERKIGGEG